MNNGGFCGQRWFLQSCQPFKERREYVVIPLSFCYGVTTKPGFPNHIIGYCGSIHSYYWLLPIHSFILLASVDPDSYRSHWLNWLSDPPIGSLMSHM